MSQVLDDSLAAGREAAARGAWRQAYDLLSPSEDTLADPMDLEIYAEAAWWSGMLDKAIALRERAFAGFTEAGENRRAAVIALQISADYFGKAQLAPSAGWFGKAERLLADEEEAPEHGYLAFMQAMNAVMVGDHEKGIAQAEKSYEIGKRFGDRDLQALALTGKGRALVVRGEVDEGLRLLDEATAAAVSGELRPFSTGLIYCVTITSCNNLGDYRRASEWTDAIADCFAKTGITSLPGDCETHSIGLLIGRGAWSEAEQRARSACAGMEPIELAHIGLALSEIGEVRLRMGDLDGAAEAFAKASENAAPPQPGTALLLLARGDPAAAAASIGAALAEAGWSNLARARLLPAQVEIALAGDDIATARSAATELVQLATVFTSPAIRAAADGADGAVLLAEGDRQGAVESLRRSADLWREASAPYDCARSRALLARALLEQGDASRARGELQAARAAFEALGARLELARLEDLDERFSDPV